MTQDARVLPSSPSSPHVDHTLLGQLSSALVPQLRQHLTLHRRTAQSMILGGGESAGMPASRSYAKLYDGLLSVLFSAARAAISQQGQWVPVSLAAVGSYGRSMLSPFSDLDVRILCDGDARSASPVAEALLYPLWDAGLNIGHQVVTQSDLLNLAEEDLPSATGLLDWRTIAGDSPVEPTVARTFQRVFRGGYLVRFIDKLAERARDRHKRFGDSVYLLEPDVKNGEGGLRDLDIAHWSARARYGVSDLSELVRHDILLPREWVELAAARSLLLRIRNALHLAVGRRSDRLTFDLQEQLAERLGYGGGGDGVERLMSDYYRSARVITRTSEMMLSRARPRVVKRMDIVALAPGLNLENGAMAISSSHALTDDPVLALKLYDEAVRRDVPVSDFSRHAIARASSSLAFCAALRKSPDAAGLFVRLACVIQPTRLKRGSVLADLHDVGLLVAMIPEFAPVIGRVHHDTYHVYTVDVHSVAALDQLRALCRGDWAVEHPLVSRMAAELPRLHVVFFATLLHDVGKAIGGEGHTEYGADMAKTILSRLQMSAEDIAEVQQLIRSHLSMYQVATRRDIEDPQTLTEFCAEVKNQQALRELYLLTVADVTTTNPTSMTNWKRRMLDELFVAADRELGGVHAQVSLRTEYVRKAVLGLWPEEQDREFVEHFLSGLPERYFYANEPTAVVDHARFARDASKNRCSIRAGGSSYPYLELWVVADDRPGLLALITATLSHAKLRVRSAQVYSWLGQDGFSRSLDIFWVRGPEEAHALRRLLPALERDLERLLAGQVDPRELAEWALSGHPRARGPAAPTIETRVSIDNHTATNHTVIEVITRDRAGLLFLLSQTIQRAGLSIWFAKINTEGQRVVDVFYVSDEQRAKVAPERIREIKQALLAATEQSEPSLPGRLAELSQRVIEAAEAAPASVR
jgi:[protein-PII] uridylyltransferase